MTNNLFWFGNNLRADDNVLLSQAVTNGPTICCFFITPKQWDRHNLGSNKRLLLLQSLRNLKEKLSEKNISLLILQVDLFKQIPDELLKICKKLDIKNVYFDAEYILNEKQCQHQVYKELKSNNIKPIIGYYNNLTKPSEILTQNKTSYSVFTPYKKQVKEILANNTYSSLDLAKQKTQPSNKNIKSIDIDALIVKQKQTSCDIESWLLNENEIQEQLNDFIKNKLNCYKNSRDIPALEATSKLSAYLAIGAVSVRRCLYEATIANNGELTGDSGASAWIDELIWRDFYHYIAYHHPKVCKGENFNSKYDGLQWSENKENLSAWQNARVGVPIIDAAIIQLKTTGWMHNRLRMIVAMFLTKNLLIDWREGQSFFEQYLVDLDFASNNGGWQWSASTGTDAAPYFRIFNPVTQSQKFDADGSFIKCYLPQLKKLDKKQIHEPYKYFDREELEKMDYCQPIVDIKQSRKDAIAVFEKI